LIFENIFKAFSLQRSRQAAAQIALFAMFVQALIPLSAAASLPGSNAETRDGQDLPAFYLVICTAYGTQTLDETTGLPLDGGPSAVMPWDCPVCQVQTSVQGPAPSTPFVAYAPRTLPHESATPTQSNWVAGLWTMGPGLARAPPSV